MNIRSRITVILVVLGLISAVAQGQKNDGYRQLWKKADSLADLNQPRSALAAVDGIYKQARTDNNDAQAIKAVIYRIRLRSEFQENFMKMTILDLRAEIARSAAPSRQVLQSILAEVYRKYYQNNLYRYRDRTRMAGMVPDSIETWDLQTIATAITRNYLLSLSETEVLKKTPVDRFDAILACEPFDEKPRGDRKAEASKFQPTLYDFLAGRALDFFTSENVPAASAERIEVDQPWYFLPTAGFIRSRMIQPTDSADPRSFAIPLYRDLATFHFSDPDPRALIETELNRLDFIHDKSILPTRDSLFLDALQQMEKTHAGSPWSANITYKMAEFLSTRGLTYNFRTGPAHRWDIKKASGLCESAMKRHPGSEGAKNCAVLAGTIRQSSLDLTIESAVPAEKPAPALLRFKNLPKAWFRLVKADPDTYENRSSSGSSRNYFKTLASQPAVKAWTQELPAESDLQGHSAEMAVPGVPAGFYVLLVSGSEDFSAKNRPYAWVPFWSTQISYISKRSDDGAIGYYILDRVTGLPLAGAMAEAWMEKWNPGSRKTEMVKEQSFTADRDGYFELPKREERNYADRRYLKIFSGNDRLYTTNYYQYSHTSTPDRAFLQTMLFTDRGIYRPGQTIYFKGILTERTGSRTVLKPNYHTTVVFNDVNGRKIAEQKTATNEFGSFNGSFTAPAGVLTGRMTIYNESGSVSVSVEEYKRPTFDVACDAMEGNYRLGETLTVSGKAMAYAGNALDGAAVKYRVVRSARFPWWDWGWFRYRPYPVSPEAEIAAGTTRTDAGGRFSISFPAIPDRSVDPETSPVFDYEISIDVTDLNGETQSTRQGVSAGYASLILDNNLTDRINLATDTAIRISATNLNGRKTPAAVTVTLYKLRDPGRIFRSRLWDIPDTTIMTAGAFHGQFPNDIFGDENNPERWEKEVVFEKTVNTAKDSVVPMRDAGSYLLVLKSQDPFGQSVEKRSFFTAFSPSSKEVPVNTTDWFVPLKTGGQPGETARFLVGSKEDNVNVICEVRRFDTLVSREWLRVSDNARLVEIPILEKYRGNVSVNFMFVKNNRSYQHSELITVPYPDKKLAVSVASFRSKPDPGSKETWTVKIARPGGKPASAEFLAGMYDASLDLFQACNWAFSLYQRYSGLSPWTTDPAFRQANGISDNAGPATGHYSFHPGLKLNWFGLGYFESYNRNPRMMHTAAMGVVEESMVVESKAMPAEMDETTATGAVPDSAATVPAAKKPADKPGFQVRRDFRETAFFYPALTTDSAGSLTLQFTVPESLTKWKFQGLAHTRDLEYGLVEKELVTQKTLMVFPNAPRFVRQGDTLVLGTKIANLSDGDLNGTVKLELAEAITGKRLDSLAGKPLELAFSAAKGQSTAVSWKIMVPVSPSISLLTYRITAIAGNFSDGEEKMIPVLTNRMLVTESLPLPVRGRGTTEFTFGKLLNSGNAGQSLKNYRLTLEFASNPAWYAIQALPSLNDKPYECADAIFNAYWSNSVASHIANSDPKIRAVFESWKALTPDALLSNLEKNQELKSALLQETPWVAEAGDETSRKQKLGQYFDAGTIEANLLQNLGKLQKLQSPSGGWSWFPGMPESRYTTQEIVTGLGKLVHLGVADLMKNPVTRDMLTRAVGFLDRELKEDYEKLKEISGIRLSDDHLSSSEIQYLYARSFFLTDPASRIPVPAASKEAFDYYSGQAARYWKNSDRTLQGMIALALNRLGNKNVPALVLKSLSERALHSPEMGIYWAEEPGTWWYQAPVEAQAMMIEAFDEVTRDSAQVEGMKVWLLKQKQTQDWRSPHATLEACYALLLRGTGMLTDDPGVKLSLGKVKINPSAMPDLKQEAGTGYFRYSWSGGEITPEMGRVAVTKSGPGVAWGAVYWQYFEDLDRITPAASPLKLEKKLFIERNTPKGPELVPFGTDGATAVLKVGDKVVVRIVVTIDRDLEFVHMKDLRASGFEPSMVVTGDDSYRSGSDALSGYRYQEGLGYYRSVTDQAVNFFFDNLPKGTYVFEYALRAGAAGRYSNGITTIQCHYAPEFGAHSEGIRVNVE